MCILPNLLIWRKERDPLMYPPKTFFQRILESAAMFALAAWLVRTGICLLQSVWGWILLLGGVTVACTIGYRFYKRYKETHF